MTRFLNGPVLNLLLVAAVGLSVYYAATLTERGANAPGVTGHYEPGPGISVGRPRSVNVATLTERMADGPSAPRAFAVEVRGTGASVSRRHLPRSVNVAYHPRLPRSSSPSSRGTAAQVGAWAATYPVNWQRRYHAEHAHVQRLLHQLRHARTVQAHETPQEIIRRVFGVYGDEAVRVASCETGGTFSPGATNGQYRGVFQMGERERAIYGDAYDVEGQARAAYRYFAVAGWGPWECRP